MKQKTILKLIIVLACSACSIIPLTYDLDSQLENTKFIKSMWLNSTDANDETLLCLSFDEEFILKEGASLQWNLYDHLAQNTTVLVGETQLKLHISSSIWGELLYIYDDDENVLGTMMASSSLCYSLELIDQGSWSSRIDTIDKLDNRYIHDFVIHVH